MWILNSNSQILIQKRSKSKRHCQICGNDNWMYCFWEESLEGAIHEAKEEIGIDITKDEMKVFRSMIHEDTLWDVYLVKKNMIYPKLFYRRKK